MLGSITIKITAFFSKNYPKDCNSQNSTDIMLVDCKECNLALFIIYDFENANILKCFSTHTGWDHFEKLVVIFYILLLKSVIIPLHFSVFIKSKLCIMYRNIQKHDGNVLYTSNVVPMVIYITRLIDGLYIMT